MITTTDPFAEKRSDPSHTPVNHLDSGQIDELKLEIRNMYKTTFTTGLAKKPKTTTAEVKGTLIKSLEVALAMSPHFQKAVTEEYVTPYIHNFGALCIDEGWLLGLYLPGFYDLFDDFDSGLKFIQKITLEASAGARKIIEHIILKYVSRMIKDLSFDSLNGRSGLRMTQTNPHVATLFQLIQEEKKQNKLRAHTYENLNELENMLPGLNGAEALRTLYKEKLTTTANDSLIDRFTIAAITAAKALGIPFELSQIDSETIHSAVDNFKSLVDFAGDQAKELVDDGVKQGREDDEPEEDESLDEVTVPGLSTDWEDVDGLPEEALVKQEVENYYSERCIFPVFYPGWCPPTTGSVFFKPASAASLLEASQTSQESNTREQDPPASLRSSSATIATKFKRAQGFIAARQLSNKEEDKIDLNIHSPQDILNGAVAYIKNATTIASDQFNSREYKECIEWLTSVKKRSEKAEAAKSSDQWFRMFCGFQMEDNWFHVRSLLAALRVEAEGRPEHDAVVQLMDGAEKNFVVTFSLIRSGADDPMPWMLVVDGVLRSLWRSVCKNMPSSDPTRLQKKLFNELALWCHGTAVNAFVIRLPQADDRYVKGQELMRKWYKMVWNYNPRCANDDCMRLLTHPSKIRNKEVRQLMSVGTREARIGTRSIRSFISTNRDNAYTCLFEVFRNSKPNQALVILLFWYSHLYHNRTCKAHSGKAAISAF